MNHPKLAKLQKKLTNYFSYFKDHDILVVSEDKESLPFCYLIMTSDYPHTVLVSVAVDYPICNNVAEIVIHCSRAGNTSLTHPFYISPGTGTTFFDEAAFEQWDIDTIDLDKLTPLSQAIN